VADHEHGPDRGPRDDGVTNGVSRVVDATLDLATAVAKTFAETAAGGKPVAPPEGGAGPVAAILHYGIVGAASAIELVLSTVGRSADTAAPPPPGGASAARPVEQPSVRRGSVLRVPLSIENPGTERMEGLTFTCLAMTGRPSGPGRPLERRHARVEPERLTVGPRDFEKLTVFVDTPPDTAPGDYEATIGLAGGGAEMRVRFAVVAKPNG
jgi:hypothetical protein